MLRAACMVIVLRALGLVARTIRFDEHRAQHAQVVDAVMLEEAVVFGREERLRARAAGSARSVTGMRRCSPICAMSSPLRV